jgi:2-dehydro-3-deoxyphosphogluconate aldolase/(4S)-4-hydroxy-2-oxoglutarate aldolase
VVRPEQVEVARDAGARFVVMPGFSARVVERCRAVGMPVIPGVATATEVIAALEHDVELLKFFPAEASGGVEAMRALHGPFPDVRFIPTGGVTSANAADYLGLPSVVAVGGSWMVAPALVRDGDFAAVSKLAAEAVAIAAGALA